MSEPTAEDREREILSNPVYKKAWLLIMSGTPMDELTEEQRSMLRVGQEAMGTDRTPGYPVPWDMDPSRR